MIVPNLDKVHANYRKNILFDPRQHLSKHSSIQHRGIASKKSKSKKEKIPKLCLAQYHEREVVVLFNLGEINILTV